jgi:hypothetical protein
LSSPALVIKIVSEFELVFVGSLLNHFLYNLKGNEVVPISKIEEYRRFIKVLEATFRYSFAAVKSIIEK